MKTPCRKLPLLFLFSLALFPEAGPFAQQIDLSISQEDALILPSEDGGFSLFIRKKPYAASVMLTEFPDRAFEQGEELFGYRAETKNEINGGERVIEYGNRIFNDGGIWFLVDSTPEPYQFTKDGAEEQAFHIYLPPRIHYGYHDTRSGTARAEHGLRVNIRCFSAPFADSRSRFTDNFFILTLDDPERPRLEPFSSKKTIQSAEPLPEPPAENQREKPFLLEAESGFMYFIPGEKGKNLRNTADFPLRLFFKAPLSEQWSVNFGYERDIILLNRLFARAAFNFGAFNITAGLAAGFLNFDSTAIGLAFSTALSAQSPNGRIFGALGLDLPFDGAQEDSSFPYEQTCFTLDTGVRLPHMIMSFRALLSVLFLRDVKEVYDIRYSTSKQTLYALTAKTDLVGRWNFSLTVGYRDVSRSVRALFLSEPYHYPSFFTCLGVFLRVNHDLELSIKADVPFYPWVFTPLPDQSDAFLFMASLGFTLRFGKP